VILKAMVTAFQFLTIIPLWEKGEITEKDVCNSSVFFPLIGALQGFSLALLSFLFLKIMSANITAVSTLIFYALVTGGFHQDGLSDTCDALSVKSSGDQENDRKKKLQVMKDSTVGPMGVIAIVLSLLLKYLLTAELLQTKDGIFVIFLMPLFSKWAMVTAMYRTKSARNDGIAHCFLEHTGLRHIFAATVFLFAIISVASCIFLRSMHSLEQFHYGILAIFFFFTIVFIYLAGFIMKNIFTARFGGLTGDNFGAIHEISELLFLTVTLLVLF